MAIQINLFGQEYDDAEPCFLTTANNMAFDRVDRNWYTVASLVAYAAKIGHVWANNELGGPSDEWISKNMPGQKFSNIAGGGTAPVNTVAPVISGDTTIESELTCDGGTWTGSPAPTLGYQWKSDGVNIAGSTETWHFIRPEDAGKTLTCVVTGVNASGSESAESNGIVADPAAFLMRGPFEDEGIVYYLQRYLDPADTKIWLEVDGDPEPDLAVTKEQLKKAKIAPMIIEKLHARLKSIGDPGFPGMD